MLSCFWLGPVVGWKTAPQKLSMSNPWSPWMCPYLDAIKIRIWRWGDYPRLFGVGPKFSDACPYRRKAGGDLRQTESRKQCDHRCRSGSEATAGQGMVTATRPGRGEGLLPLSRRGGVALTLQWRSSGIQNCEKINSFCFKPARLR